MTVVLVVDDDESFLRLMTMLLRPHKIDVLAARTVPESLELAHNNPTDIVLMDICLPGVEGTGWDGIRAFKNDVSLSNIPIIAITAAGLESCGEKLDPSTYEGLLFKPFTATELLPYIRKFT